MQSVVERFQSSYVLAVSQYEERVAQGTQPALPFASLEFLFFANVGYIVITAVLYFLMSSRKEGFQLRYLIAAYNAVCVFLAGWVVFGIVKLKLQRPGTFACNPSALPDEFGQNMSFYFWLFYIQKFWEFLDTWFFILRKNFHQVSLLHVYHHSSITFVVGLQIPYTFSGDMYLPISLNAGVHVLMYSYYFVTVLGIKSIVSKIKPYLTSLQLIQFLLIAYQNWYSYSMGPECAAPDFGKLVLIFYMVTMVLLFGNFFVQQYVFKVREKKSVKTKDAKPHRD